MNHNTTNPTDPTMTIKFQFVPLRRTKPVNRTITIDPQWGICGVDRIATMIAEALAWQDRDTRRCVYLSIPGHTPLTIIRAVEGTVLDAVETYLIEHWVCPFESFDPSI